MSDLFADINGEITMIIDERMDVFINSVHKGISKEMAEFEKEAIDNYVPIIRKPTQILLRYILTSNKPKRILEVGAAVGFSSIYMSDYLEPEAKIDTIERMEERVIEARKNIKKYGKEDVINLIEGDATEVLKELEGPYDMIFLDAAKGQYINFFEDIMRLLSPGGILVSDNVLQDGEIIESKYAINKRDRTIHGRMRDYLYVINHDERLESVVLPNGDGVALSYRV